METENAVVPIINGEPPRVISAEEAEKMGMMQLTYAFSRSEADLLGRAVEQLGSDIEWALVRSNGGIELWRQAGRRRNNALAKLLEVT
jgi:hypothetical protein